jgi:hypothetical protein
VRRRRTRIPFGCCSQRECEDKERNEEWIPSGCCSQRECKDVHKDLHTSTEPKDKMEGGFLLDVVIRKGSSILDLGLYIVDGIRRLHFKSDCLASKGFNEDHL